MPVDLDVLPNGKLRVAVIEHPLEVNYLLAHLLSSQLDRSTNSWSLSWNDFHVFREKLDAAGFLTGRSATDAGVAWVQAHEAELARLDAIKRGDENDAVRLPGTLRTKPYGDQLAAIRFLSTRRRALLADQMGLGKTIEALGAFACLHAEGKARHALLVCPNSVKPGLRKEVGKHTQFSVSVLGNGTEQATNDFFRYAQRRTDFLVVHYDALVAPGEPRAKKGEVPKPRKHAPVPWSPLVDEILRLDWDFILYDEAHLLKTPEAKRTQACLSLVERARTATKQKPHLILATGTPISETPLDAWTMLLFVAPELLDGIEYARFENHFSKKQKVSIGRSRTAMQTVGYQNLGELKELLHSVMIRRLKTDVRGMPEKIEQTRYVEIGGAQKKLYDDIRAGVYDALVGVPGEKLSIEFAMTKLMRLRQVLSHPALVGKPGPSAKHEEIDGLLEEVLSDPMAKAVIWTEWRESVDLLEERYKKYGVIRLLGGTPSATMERWSRNWDVMPEKLAIGTPAFGGTGVDFLSRCRTAIYVEPPFSTILFRQSLDRIHRRVNADSTDPIERIKASPANLIFLQAEKTIDEFVYAQLASKGDLVDALLVEDEKLLEIGKADLLSYLK